MSRLCYCKRVGSKWRDEPLRTSAWEAKWLGVFFRTHLRNKIFNKIFNTDFLVLDEKIQAFLKGLKFS